MKRLEEYLEKWMEGKNVRGISMSPLDIKECFYVYKALVRKEKPEFLNEKVKEILDRCGIKTITCGIGWKIA